MTRIEDSNKPRPANENTNKEKLDTVKDQAQTIKGLQTAVFANINNRMQTRTHQFAVQKGPVIKNANETIKNSGSAYFQ